MAELLNTAKTKRVLCGVIVVVMLAASASLFACSSGDSASSANDAAAEATMSVQVDVTAYEEEFFFGAVSLPEGATALDALEATGLDYVVEDSQYGAFVSEINDLANGETSPTAGWTYALNNEMALESCDVLVLSDGDTLTWEYAEFE